MHKRNYELTGEEEKLQAVSDTMANFVKAAKEYETYISKPRKYGTDDLLYMREVHFMQTVDSLPSPEIGEIAKRLNVTPGAVSQTAARLEAKGLLIRQKSQEDSRVVLCQLTDRAKQITEFHKNLDRKEYLILGETLSQFSNEEIEKIYKFLDIFYLFFRTGNERFK